jgi:lipoic acid synthetase
MAGTERDDVSAGPTEPTADRPFARKPDWLAPEWSESRGDFEDMQSALRDRELVTVCEEASCPNINECWANEGTATFMIMGDSCTRTCGFCDVATGGGAPLDPDEPAKLADAVDAMGLDHAVITSVDRDDLPDQGAGHFAHAIDRVRTDTGARVEALIPDFQGERDLLRTVVEAGPAVLAHNVETVERLQQPVRDPRAGYQQSLRVLERAKELVPDIVTKSSIMVGLGETPDEVETTLRDLRDAAVDIVTLGQYCRPSRDHLGVEEYVHPDRFAEYERIAAELGFGAVAAGPLVRSSYRAGAVYAELHDDG